MTLVILVGFLCITSIAALCDDGHFQNTLGQCELCSIGHKCPNDLLDVEIACEPGTFQPAQGELSCINCPINEYSNAFAQPECQKCSQSFYTPSKSTACGSTCSDGYYKNGISCLVLRTCNIREEYYTINSVGNRECHRYTQNCSVSFGEYTSCSVAGSVQACRFRKNYLRYHLNGTNDRVCVQSEKCRVDEYMFREQQTDSAGVELKRQECKSYHECNVAGGEYYMVDGRVTQDRDHVCAELTTCLDREYEVVQSGRNQDRQCRTLTVCDQEREYMLTKGGGKQDNVCTDKTQCTLLQFQLHVANDSYISTQNGTDTVCQNHSVCRLGERVAITGSVYTDTQCEDCPEGTFGDGVECSACPTGTFSQYNRTVNCTVCDNCKGSNFTSLCNVTHDNTCITICPDSWLLDHTTRLCAKCAAGYFDEEGVHECMLCPADHYCPSKYKKHMKPCPTNSVRNSTSPAGSHIATACQCNREGGYQGNPFSHRPKVII
jgi:hypothetical protein